MFYTAVGLAAMKRSQPISRSFVSAETPTETVLGRRMLDLAQTCITFCGEMGHLTEYVGRFTP